MDNDGKTAYCHVVMLQVDCGAQTIIVYPNPANQDLYINLQGYRRARAQLENMLGQKVDIYQLKEGVNMVKVGEIPTGIYLLRFITDSGQISSQKIEIR